MNMSDLPASTFQFANPTVSTRKQQTAHGVLACVIQVFAWSLDHDSLSRIYIHSGGSRI